MQNSWACGGLVTHARADTHAEIVWGPALALITHTRIGFPTRSELSRGLSRRQSEKTWTCVPFFCYFCILVFLDLCVLHTFARFADLRNIRTPSHRVAAAVAVVLNPFSSRAARVNGESESTLCRGARSIISCPPMRVCHYVTIPEGRASPPTRPLHSAISSLAPVSL